MKKIKYKIVSGRDDDKRVPSRILEEMIQKEVKQGHRAIEVDAFGQHGIGGRLWQEGNDTIKIRIRGQAGQRSRFIGVSSIRKLRFWVRYPMMWAGSMPVPRLRCMATPPMGS